MLYKVLTLVTLCLLTACNRHADLPSVPSDEKVLTVKFEDSLRVRATPEGNLTARADADLSEINKIQKEFDIRFSQLLSMDSHELDEYRRETEETTGKLQPDLAAIMEIHIESPSVKKLQRIQEALDVLPEVEFTNLRNKFAPSPPLK